MHKRKTILLVEDNPQLMEIIAAFLTMWGYEVFEATTHREVLLALSEAGTSLCAVVSDFQLVDCNGTDVIASIKRSSPNMPSIVMTGSLLSETVASEMGVPILRKPFHPKQLQLLLSEVLTTNSVT